MRLADAASQLEAMWQRRVKGYPVHLDASDGKSSRSLYAESGSASHLAAAGGLPDAAFSPRPNSDRDGITLAPPLTDRDEYSESNDPLEALMPSSPYVRKAPLHRFCRVCLCLMHAFASQRLVARQGDSQYCRLSVAFALLARPSLLFYIPSKAFYPQPKVLFAAFGQRRKMLRQSLKSILPPGVSVPEEFGALRPQALAPSQFVELTAALFGRNGADDLAGREAKANSADSTETVESLLTDPPPIPRIPAVWRRAKHGHY
ncbi:uncharacterized protein LOC113146876 [Cyclospora cayetanensis]|uniref:Uncharacterized protein LOC113146876 n=1 Tax=Cyclospora cayetanensis TaxID=88456 RepID=A0A6P6RV22_9EIME|nr:uncharacterized protein LOC113146876 [Cyclospora cayetanensis]